tara:strand:+ start:459 stop:701 length:243 start_codon:yes stop_codon:yes gene_type:complete
MPVNDIIQQALDNNPLNLKKSFDDEMTTRVRSALNQKYQDMTDEHPEVAEVEAMGSEDTFDEVDVHSGQTVESVETSKED